MSFLDCEGLRHWPACTGAVPTALSRHVSGHWCWAGDGCPSQDCLCFRHWKSAKTPRCRVAVRPDSDACCEPTKGVETVNATELGEVFARHFRALNLPDPDALKDANTRVEIVVSFLTSYLRKRDVFTASSAVVDEAVQDLQTRTGLRRSMWCNVLMQMVCAKLVNAKTNQLDREGYLAFLEFLHKSFSVFAKSLKGSFDTDRSLRGEFEVPAPIPTESARVVAAPPPPPVVTPEEPLEDEPEATPSVRVVNPKPPTEADSDNASAVIVIPADEATTLVEMLKTRTPIANYDIGATIAEWRAAVDGFELGTEACLQYCNATHGPVLLLAIVNSEKAICPAIRVAAAALDADTIVPVSFLCDEQPVTVNVTIVRA